MAGSDAFAWCQYRVLILSMIVVLMIGVHTVAAMPAGVAERPATGALGKATVPLCAVPVKQVICAALRSMGKDKPPEPGRLLLGYVLKISAPDPPIDYKGGRGLADPWLIVRRTIDAGGGLPAGADSRRSSATLFCVMHLSSFQQWGRAGGGS